MNSPTLSTPCYPRKHLHPLALKWHSCSAGGLPRRLSGKESTCQAGDTGSASGSGRSPGGGNGNPLPYSCLENPMNRGTWWATVHRVTNNWTRLNGLSMHAHNSVPRRMAWLAKCKLNLSHNLPPWLGALGHKNTVNAATLSTEFVTLDPRTFYLLQL